jgi:hypothetical protein
MTESPQQSAQAVAALFAERRRFESWLATLDAKRAITPAHIYTRVHADYTARLQRVNEQLGRHRAALREMESGLADRLTSLDIDEAKHRDEMAEAELRENVGELEPEEHREILERTALGLEQVTAERLHVTAELTNLRAMLGDDGEIGVLEIGAADVTVTETPPAMAAIPPAKRTSKGAATPAAPSPPAAAAPSERDAWGLEAGDPLAVTARASSPEPAAPASPFDDLEFLRSMVDSRKSGDHNAVGNGASAAPAKAATPPPAAPPAPPPAAPPAPAAAPEELKRPAAQKTEEKPKEPEKEKAAPPPPAPAPAAIVTAPLIETLATAPPMRESVAASAAAEASAKSKIIDPSISMELEPVSKPRGSSDAIPSYLRDVPPEQVKTLKCQECGTLNYPTEWYCERCGAELAAL